MEIQSLRIGAQTSTELPERREGFHSESASWWTMIRDLSETMRAILDDPTLASAFPELAAAQILFDRPVEGFKPAQATVDLFLYDVRENMELRSNEPIIERNNGQAIIHRPPMRVLCSYLVTAWPGNVTGDELALGEHRLLSQTLQALSRLPTIPPAYLKGKLTGQEPPLPMITAQTDGLKNPSEFWTALGNKLRPSISLSVTISMEPFVPETAHIVDAAEVRIGLRVPELEKKEIVPATLQGFFHVVGKVTDEAGAPAAGATVEITSLSLARTNEAGTSVHLTASADPSGVYSFDRLPPGSYSLRARKDTKEKIVTITVPAAAGDNYNYNLKLTG